MMVDSGTGESLQSSSGGEDEHDSRAQRFSTAGLVRPMTMAMAKPPNPPPTNHVPFDPFSNFFDPSPTNPIQPQSVMPTTMPINPIQLQVPNDQVQPPSRNPRKRTRASRRAPTTVLTTDTTNFRAMVQEFTGIPAPPFTPVSPFSRPRLDNVVFGGSSTSTPPYLLRPFPQKLSPFLSPPPPPSSDFLLPKHNPNPNPNPSIFNLHATQTTLEPNRNLLHLPATSLPEELLSGNVRDGGSGGGNMVPASWGSGGSGSDQALFRSMNEKYSSGTKLNINFSASSSSNFDFHGDEGSENVTNRTEGNIESWVCSSD